MNDTPHPTADELTERMAAQRAVLHRQFVSAPQQRAAAVKQALEPDDTQTRAMAERLPFQPRSHLMRLFIAHPQVLQRLALAAVTTVLGVRYARWAAGLLGLFSAARPR